jgi:carbamoyltransferase
MSTVFGEYGPKLRLIPRLVQRVVDMAYSRWAERRSFYRPQSRYARQKGEEFRARLGRGEVLHLLGIGPFGHNTGVALVRVSTRDGIEILANNEEERFSGEKHTNKFPIHAIEETRRILRSNGVGPEDIFCALASWDYVGALGFDLRVIFEHAPRSLVLVNPKYDPTFNLGHLVQGLSAPARLAEQLGLKQPLPIIGMHHHRNHAYLAYALSPFAGCDETVMVAVLDGTGDNGAISLYTVRGNCWECVRENGSTIDSLGYLYGYISSTQGGWTFLSSEGRYMGAAAWGNGNRMTNPYYKRLRQILYFGGNGEVLLNRRMINWHIHSHLNPYAPELVEILGPPIPAADRWNPDNVLNVDDVEHSEITQDRVDKAIALQMVYEDGLHHVIDFLIRRSGANKLVLTGGTALNCIANRNLLSNFGCDYYRRYIGIDGHLQIWVPPVPNDCGVALGATVQFAMKNGAPARTDFHHPYLCGTAPDADTIRAAMKTEATVEWVDLGDAASPRGQERLAGLMAAAVSRNAVLGIFQGRAETGPRALGNRSILANPCNPHTRDVLNSRVKYRERVRPLAPMVTLAEARRLFHLDEGAAANNYSAYDYMVLAVRARGAARALVPAVVHQDGTSRIQIVRPETNPLMYAFLLAMGRACGVQVSVNTSLNVGSPIVQTPSQAIRALLRAKAMDGLILVSGEGRAFAAWRSDMSRTSELPSLIDSTYGGRP